jgi:hypothetical protein
MGQGSTLKHNASLDGDTNQNSKVNHNYLYCKRSLRLVGMELRATSHTRLRARDQHTSSTLIGRKGGAGPSSLHTTLEGPTEYVDAQWMWSLHGFLHDIDWVMFHGHLDYFQKPPFGGRPNTKPGDHGTLNAHNCWLILFYHVWGPAWIEIHWIAFG